jgi:serine/threonine protein kinase
MSPEQAQDAGRVSAATDVYGVGATLYAVLTGRPPFQGTTVADTLHQVKYREQTPPRKVNHAVDRDLNTIILACLEKEPERRYGSAAEGLVDLTIIFEGRTQVAVSLEEVLLESDGLAVGRDGLVQPTTIFERVAQVVVGRHDEGKNGRETQANCGFNPPVDTGSR